ncbi:arylsulfatase [Bradyrhizobium canariense]|uniref:Arylsulfatase n=1 Tax=Bradyrhizobium canariense TaxID=255045 RepID=A0A1X3GY12_9BRAD|nr:arylsulfatase [Bradyrhizobium canariense]OSI60258.1 arylsulfatase [Bradyrhizobium canariense]OSI65371.1 arylsulfatase [Bradyrhizobium canariense]OSI75847.1 arylsulfatase [Bradyrhizobium canariense]OSI85606.1 arylsulfatase [Bradyrhizobium canariense]OSI87027.1 arylsulfatase [Bradyrhizobium canariense]
MIPALAVAAILGAPALAQQVTGAPGSPDATTTIDGRYLPGPPRPFQGEINLNALQSKSAWPARVVPPKGAPNILLIMTDDVGFGAPSTFGGIIPTPTMDRIAANGLRYTNFHTTSLCSPTRAALLTGRNHHSVGFGVISEIATGFPGYNSVMGPESATVGRILKDNGYRTSWYGKNHNTPAFETSQAGPFDQWPTGMGFDYFYGFNAGDVSQWEPMLTRNTTPITPFVGNPGWNLVTAMADEAVGWMKQLNDLDPSLPFMIYYAPGATHSPHHPTPEWIKKISDMHLFDKGFQSVREQIFANQKKLGVIPPEAQLTPWPKDKLKEWDQHTPEEKKLLVKQADVYGAYLAYADHEIGRVVQAVEDMGKLDNTIVIYISGDNGASAEGSAMGTWNEVLPFNGISPTAAENMRLYDAWGDAETYPHYSFAWAWTFDTPFKWTKQIASYFGGTKNGMAISWPAKIKDKGGTRWQFHHVIDVVPTLLEIAGVPAPIQVDGIAQKPIEGVSLAYTFDRDAGGFDAPSRHRTQYFEMMGVQGLYNDGWMLSAVPLRAPWDLASAAVADPATAFNYELYQLKNDWTQFTDVAAKNPKKVQEMRDLMFGEFARYQVLPLDASAATRFVAPRPSLAAGRTIFEYSGSTVTNIPEGNMPSLLNTSYTMAAEINVPQSGADGMIYNEGGRFFGYGLYLLRGKPVFTYNFQGLKRTRWEGEALAPGKHTIEFDFRYDGLGAATLAYNDVSGVGRGGTGALKVDGKVVSTQKIEHTIPLTKPLDTVVNIGAAAGTPVDDGDYKIPFRFTGKIDKLTIALDRPKLTPEDVRKLKEAELQKQQAK